MVARRALGQGIALAVLVCVAMAQAQAASGPANGTAAAAAAPPTPASVDAPPGAAGAAPAHLPAQPRSSLSAQVGSALHPPGRVVVFNRGIAEFRAPFLGMSARERAADATDRVRRLFAEGGEGKVTLNDIPQGVAVLIDGQFAFAVLNEDARAMRGESARSLAEGAALVLKQVATETHEARDRRFLAQAAIRAAVATAIWLALMWIARWLWRATAQRLMRAAERHAERLRVGGGEVISRRHAIATVRRGAAVVATVTMLLLTWEWLGYVLGLFPYTRPWSEGLTGFLVGTTLDVLEGIARGLPSMFVALLIFAIAWFVDRALRGFFDRVAEGRIVIRAFDRDTAAPTKRLATIAVWVFAAAMAYPYIPGSDTDAFKGLSVLLGLMVTVGASGIVGQAASGLILMYTRTYRPGEFVRIGEREGTIVRMGLFTTTVRTGLGEELTMPNSQVLGTVTTNYSRSMPGGGFAVSAAVSIGYDAPWRQVHALLVEAARHAEGIAQTPEPQVFQTALDDFYVRYQVVCCATASDPVQRAAAISSLYASIQDRFNEHGVQIMSPHFLGDPAVPKVVPKAKWHASPAPPGPST